MKILLAICVFVFATSGLFAQTVVLKITDLKGSPITLKSANLESVSVKSARGGLTDAICYVITRNQNELSVAIMAAISTKKSYGSAELIVTLKNGKKLVHDLKSATLSHYTSTNIAGKNPTEQFYLQFMTDEIRGNK